MHFGRSQLTGPIAIVIANSEKPDSFSVHRAPQPHSPRPRAGHAPAGEGLETLPLTPLAGLGWAGPARTVFTAGMDCILAPEHISATSPQGRELFRQSAGRLAASLKTAPRGQTELTWVGRGTWAWGGIAQVSPRQPQRRNHRVWPANWGPCLVVGYSSLFQLQRRRVEGQEGVK